MNTTIGKCPVCGHALQGLPGGTDTSSSGYRGLDLCYDIYHCDECHSIIKADIWDNEGLTIILYDNQIHSLPNTKIEWIATPPRNN